MKTYSWSSTFPVYHIFVISYKRSRPRCLQNQIYGNNFRRDIFDRRFIQLFWHNMTLLSWMPFLRVPIKLSLRFEQCLNARQPDLYFGFLADNHPMRSRIDVLISRFNSQVVGVRYCLGCRKGLVSPIWFFFRLEGILCAWQKQDLLFLRIEAI